jgi:hypothetical protein
LLGFVLIDPGDLYHAGCRCCCHAARLGVSTGRLAVPTDLPFDENHLEDPDALATAVVNLLARKPHLAFRRPVGEIGHGASPSATRSVDLAALCCGNEPRGRNHG